jgi:hypothetical protein
MPALDRLVVLLHLLPRKKRYLEYSGQALAVRVGVTAGCSAALKPSAQLPSPCGAGSREQALKLRSAVGGVACSVDAGMGGGSLAASVVYCGATRP